MTIPELFTPTTATNVSGTVDGTAAYPAAGAATFILGSNTGAAAPNRHVHLRFDLSSVAAIGVDVGKIWGAILFVKLNAKGGSGCDIGVWGSEFGASMTNADYNGDESNASPVRQFIGTILTSSASPGDVGYLYIPSRFISTSTGGVCDLELRPANGATYDYDVTVLGDTMTIDGSTAAGSGYTITPTIDGLSPASNPADDKPRLMVLHYTSAELAARAACKPAISEDSYVAFDLQNGCLNEVKADTYLDLLSSSLDSNAENLISDSIRQERVSPVKYAPGGTAAGGDVSFHMTPEKCTKLLLGFLKQTAISGPVSTTYNGVSYDVYTRTWKPAQTREVPYFTFVQKIEDNNKEVYKSCMLDTFTLSVGTNNLLTGSISLLAEEVSTYDEYAAGENDEYIIASDAAYDTYAPMSFVGGQIEKNSALFEKITNLTISFSNNTSPTRVIRRKRGPKHIFPGKMTVAVSFDMYFEDLDEVRKYLGVNHTKFPFKARREITLDEMDFKFAGELKEDVQEISFNFPKMMYQVISKGIAGNGPIILSATAICAYDSSSGGNVVVTVKNTEEAADFAVSTNKITVLAEEE